MGARAARDGTADVAGSDKRWRPVSPARYDKKIKDTVQIQRPLIKSFT
jgi:hypothetical protein